MSASGETGDHWPRVGSTFGRYRIDGFIGRGSMGIVLRALDTVLGRPVALKLLPADLTANDAARAAFLAEARIAAALDHPAILPIHEAGVQDGLPFLAMRYVPGRDLGRILRDEAPLPVSTTIRIAGQVAAGLDAAHRRGVLHRDVKPGNILVEDGPQQVAYLADFGLAHARMFEARPPDPAGSPGYVAPEVLSGGVVDGRADQYALARVVAHCLLDGGEIRGAGGMDDGDPPTDQPALVAVLRRGLSVDPRDRYPDCSSLVDAVARALEPDPMPAVPAPLVPAPHPGQAGPGVSVRSVTRWRDRRPARRPVASVLSVALVAGMLALLPWVPQGGEPSRSPDAQRRWERATAAWAESAALAVGYGGCDPELTKGGDRRCPPRTTTCRPQRAGVQFEIGGAVGGVKCLFSKDQSILNLFLFGFANEADALLWWNYEVGEFGQTGPDPDACSEGRIGRTAFTIGTRSGVLGCWFSRESGGNSWHWWLAWHDDNSTRTGLLSSRSVEGGEAIDHAELLTELYADWRKLPPPLGPAGLPLAGAHPSPG